MKILILIYNIINTLKKYITKNMKKDSDIFFSLKYEQYTYINLNKSLNEITSN